MNDAMEWIFIRKNVKYCDFVINNEIFSFPGEYTSTKLHSKNVKSRHNITQTETPQENQYDRIKENLESAM